MMNIQLITSTVQHLELKHFPLENAKEKIEDDKSFDLSYRTIFSNDNKRMFANSFQLHLEHPGEFILDIEYISWFQTNEDINEAFKDSTFTKVNVPAIAYPYLRSIVSTFTVLSGFPSAILPTINFIDFSKKQLHER